MNCKQAQQLFDAYIDGELSQALATELGAHRVRCNECRRALALLEVSGHILASGDDSASLSDGFEDRLLACVEKEASFGNRFRRVLYVAMPLAAAAVVALAFLGVFDRSQGHVLGEKQELVIDEADLDPILRALDMDDAGDELPGADAQAIELDQWGQRMQKNLQSFQDLTIYQWLDVLEKAKDTSGIEDHYPGADPLAEPEPAAEPPSRNTGNGGV